MKLTLNQLSAFLIVMGLPAQIMLAALFLRRTHALSRSLGVLFSITFAMDIVRLLTVMGQFQSPSAITLTTNVVIATGLRALHCVALVWVCYRLRWSQQQESAP